MTKILYTNDNGTVCIRDEKGKFLSVPASLFQNEEIVKTSSKHYSQKSFTMVLEPTWTKTRGWVYGERYISRNRIDSGGSGWWNNADLYEQLDNPTDILIAEKLQLEKRKKEQELSIIQINHKLSHLNFALKTIGYEDKENE